MLKRVVDQILIVTLRGKGSSLSVGSPVIVAGTDPNTVCSCGQGIYLYRKKLSSSYCGHCFRELLPGEEIPEFEKEL